MSKLAIMFPGIGYHCDKPLLYYGGALVRELGYTQCRKLSYQYDGTGIRGDEEKMREAAKCLYLQAEQQLSDVAFAQYEEIVFVSKSIGTVIAAAYAKKYEINCRHILYTPLAQTYDFTPERGIAFLGTADAWSDVGKVAEKSLELGIPMHLYENANHSLETEDVIKNVEVLREVLQMTKQYLTESEGCTCNCHGERL